MVVVAAQQAVLLPMVMAVAEAEEPQWHEASMMPAHYPQLLLVQLVAVAMVEQRAMLPKMTVTQAAIHRLVWWITLRVVFLLLPTVAVAAALRTTSGVVEEAEAAQVMLACRQLLVLGPMAEGQLFKIPLKEIL